MTLISLITRYVKEMSECVQLTLHKLSLNNSSLAPQACYSSDSNKCSDFSSKYRTPDGSCALPNDKGRSFTPYRRLLSPVYSDGNNVHLTSNYF